MSSDRRRSLLASARHGVVAMSVRAMPMAFPVVFALLDNDVIVRTSRAGVLGSHMTNHIVTFVTYEYPLPERGSGWTVAATGRAVGVDDPMLLQRCEALSLPLIGPSDAYIRIPLDLVVGYER